MEIKKFKEKLKKNTISAINGCIKGDALYEYLCLLDGDYKIINLYYEIIFEENNGIEDYLSNNKIEKSSIYNLDVHEKGHREFLKIFRNLCDKSNYIEKFEEAESILLVSGDWDTNLVHEKLKEDGISYHFTEGHNLFYCMDLRIKGNDSKTYKNGYYRNRQDLWEYILDYSKGEILSTWFLSDIIQDQISLGLVNKTIQSNCARFMQIIKGTSLWVEIEKIFKDHDHIHSYSTQYYQKSYDVIKRSNLFQHKGGSGDWHIFKTNNFLSRYTLYNLGRKTDKIAYQPQFPILRKHMTIAEEVLDIEKEIKHVLIDYFDKNGIFINKIPLRIKSSDDNMYVINPKKSINSLDKMYMPSSYNRDIEFYINSLTFGELLHLMTDFEKIQTVSKEFKIGTGKGGIDFPSNNLFKLEKDGGRFMCGDNAESVNLDLKDMFHLKNVSFDTKSKIITVLKNGIEDCDYYLIKDRSIENKISNSGVVISYIEHHKNSDSKYTSIFNNFTELKVLLNEIRDYRNAILHNQNLDDSTTESFNKKSDQFYRLISINS